GNHLHLAVPPGPVDDAEDRVMHHAVVGMVIGSAFKHHDRELALACLIALGDSAKELGKSIAATDRSADERQQVFGAVHCAKNDPITRLPWILRNARLPGVLV